MVCLSTLPNRGFFQNTCPRAWEPSPPFCFLRGLGQRAPAVLLINEDSFPAKRCACLFAAVVPCRLRHPFFSSDRWWSSRRRRGPLTFSTFYSTRLWRLSCSPARFIYFFFFFSKRNHPPRRSFFPTRNDVHSLSRLQHIAPSATEFFSVWKPYVSLNGVVSPLPGSRSFFFEHQNILFPFLHFFSFSLSLLVVCCDFSRFDGQDAGMFPLSRAIDPFFSAQVFWFQPQGLGHFPFCRPWGEFPSGGGDFFIVRRPIPPDTSPFPQDGCTHDTLRAELHPSGPQAPRLSSKGPPSIRCPIALLGSSPLREPPARSSFALSIPVLFLAPTP